MTNPVIYYIGDESASAEALQKDLKLSYPKQTILCASFPAKVSALPEEIILLAHTDDSKQHIGDKTPIDLAQQFKNLYKNNTTTLLSIKLISCEAGHGENPLAKQLVDALSKQGFENVTVHAVTHPKKSAGGEVSVITEDNNLARARNGQVSALLYANEESKKHSRYKELRRKGISKHTQQEKVEYQQLAPYELKPKNYQQISLISEIAELNQPRNTYRANQTSPQLSLEVAVALDYLRTQYRIAPDKSLQEKISGCINDLENNPSYDQNKILSAINRHKLPVQVNNSITQNIALARKNTSAQTQSSSNHEDYLDRLLLNQGGLLNRILYWLDLTKTRSFTKYLSQQLHIIKTKEPALQANIRELEEELKNSNTQATNNNQTIIDQLAQSVSNLFTNTTKKDSPTPNQSEDLTSLKKQFADIQTTKTNIKKNINKEITMYIDAHKQHKDTMHQAKVAVMQAIQTYLNDPNDNNWKKLTQLTTKSEQWSNGFFSKVDATMKQVELFHEELINSNTPSPGLSQ